MNHKKNIIFFCTVLLLISSIFQFSAKSQDTKPVLIDIYQNFNNINENRLNLIFNFEEDYPIETKINIAKNSLYVEPDSEDIVVTDEKGTQHIYPRLLQTYPYSENINKFNFFISSTNEKEILKNMLFKDKKVVFVTFKKMGDRTENNATGSYPDSKVDIFIKNLEVEYYKRANFLSHELAHVLQSILTDEYYERVDGAICKESKLNSENFEDYFGSNIEYKYINEYSTSFDYYSKFIDTIPKKFLKKADYITKNKEYNKVNFSGFSCTFKSTLSIQMAKTSKENIMNDAISTPYFNKFQEQLIKDSLGVYVGTGDQFLITNNVKENPKIESLNNNYIQIYTYTGYFILFIIISLGILTFLKKAKNKKNSSNYK
jgi:hypothetical protein